MILSVMMLSYISTVVCCTSVMFFVFSFSRTDSTGNSNSSSSHNNGYDHSYKPNSIRNSSATVHPEPATYSTSVAKPAGAGSDTSGTYHHQNFAALASYRLVSRPNV